MDKKKILSSRNLQRVYLIDNQPLYRMGFIQTVSRSGLFDVCLESESYIFDSEEFAWIDPDIIVMDLIYDGRSPFDFIVWVHDNFPSVPILVLSMLDEKIYAERALKAGATGYLMKNTDGSGVLTALKTVAKHELSLSSSISSQIVSKYVSGTEKIELEPTSVLSDREIEIFFYIGGGKTSREISRILNISIKTVDNHKTSIREKLSLRNHIELSQKAVLWRESSGERR
ncbi:MAG TPA: response regulator transcription factor [Spirochaetota bacterium]|nr:response regulator transcription factor [Spirochaetota bacterium]